MVEWNWRIFNIYYHLLEHVRAKFRLIDGEGIFMLQESVSRDYGGTDIGIHSGGWIFKIRLCNANMVEVFLREGSGSFNPFMCGGDLRWEGVRKFQVWVDVTVRSLSWSELFHSINKFLGVRFLGRGGG